MIFREFKSTDISDICELLNNELGYSVDEKDLTVRINQMIENENYCIFVSEINKKIVGFIGLNIGLAFEFSGKVMRIIALAVKEEYQNHGIGKQLLLLAENYGIENQIKVIAVNSGLNRTQAHQFYEKQGFYKKGYCFAKILESN
jgi:ribosomal protein S18 acetylase RimI-like enzyme